MQSSCAKAIEEEPRLKRLSQRVSSNFSLCLNVSPGTFSVGSHLDFMTDAVLAVLEEQDVGARSQQQVLDGCASGGCPVHKNRDSKRDGVDSDGHRRHVRRSGFLGGRFGRLGRSSSDLGGRGLSRRARR